MYKLKGINMIWLLMVIFVIIVGILVGVWLGLKSESKETNPATVNTQEGNILRIDEVDEQEYLEARARAFEEMEEEVDSRYYDEDLYNELEVDTDNQYDDPYDDPYYDEDS